jgi:hypothetical protein
MTSATVFYLSACVGRLWADWPLQLRYLRSELSFRIDARAPRLSVSSRPSVPWGATSLLMTIIWPDILEWLMGIGIWGGSEWNLWNHEQLKVNALSRTSDNDNENDTSRDISTFNVHLVTTTAIDSVDTLAIHIHNETNSIPTQEVNMER